MMPEIMAFVMHPDRPEARELALRMEAKLLEKDVRVIYPQEGEQAERCSLVMTFGGDGTLLIGARSALRYDCPLLGINLGTLGFLTEGDPSQMEGILDAALRKEYIIEQRGMLQVRVNGSPETFQALNDAVVTRGGFARLIQVETRINEEHWGTFIADGVIAATPTGSTGYSLSAGGPVVAPGVECVVVTPVCAHSLQHCPCIVPTGAEIRFHLRREREQLAQLQIDGQNVCTLRAGDTVQVTGSGRALQLARMGEYRFFTVLQSKLNEWSRPREGMAP